MNSYNSDTYLLDPHFQSIASWWDSIVFIDRKNPDVILKLYDPLDYTQVLRYYEIQKELSLKWWILSEADIDVTIVDPTIFEQFSVLENED